MRDSERYDAMLESGELPATPCPVCTGDDEAEPCSEECAHLILRAACIAACRGLYAGARQAIAFARLYQAECNRHGWDPHLDQRVADCVAEANKLRGNIRALRYATRQPIAKTEAA